MVRLCEICNKHFATSGSLRRHINQVHNKVRNHVCSTCEKTFQRTERLAEHQLSHSSVRQQSAVFSLVKAQRSVQPTPLFVQKTSTHLKKVLCLTLQGITLFGDLWSLYRQCKSHIRNMLLHHLQSMHMLKFDFILKVLFYKAVDTSEKITCYFHSKTHTLIQTRDASPLILRAFNGLNRKIEDYLERGSGWVIENIQEFDIHVVRYKPYKGATYLELPPQLQNRRGIINIKNHDNKCFIWSVLAALHPVQNSHEANRTFHYERYISELHLDGIEFPVRVTDIELFEHMNSLSINVYGYDNNKPHVRVLYLSGNQESETKINFLLYNQQHYCCIKDIERFLSTEIGTGHRRFQCHLCLCIFYSCNKRDKHRQRCQSPNLETVEMPEDSQLRFRNQHKMLPQPYIIYADFECLLEKVSTCLQSPQTSHTTPYQKHAPCGYGVAEVLGCCSNVRHLRRRYAYRGQNSVEHFFEVVVKWGEEYQQLYDDQKRVQMSVSDWLSHKAATHCSLCKKELNDDRVIDHCHLCGKYRGTCHSSCNIKYRLTRDVVVVFHNLRRYDGHLLLEQLGHVCNQRKGVKVNVIPKGFDDYLTFSLRFQRGNTSWNMKFIDSFQFLSASFSKLVDNLKTKGDATFVITRSHFPQHQVPLLLPKGIYPYDYMDAWTKFDERQLPPIQQFESTLTDESISTEDYNHAQQVWTAFSMRTLGEYHDLYLMTDVLLLADVFENFRSFCLNTYELDPAHYFTAPSFSWDACLKMTAVELELLTDPDMYTFLEAGIRGGISIITHRYAKANNPLVPDYKNNLLTSYIMYLDANNLYGWTMTCPLPVSGFHWLSHEAAELDVTAIADDASEGYILEVDLEYPEHLHHSHNDYPLAVERLQVMESMLSPYCMNVAEGLSVASAKIKKLIPNLCTKRNYIVHYRNLKLYLSLGLKLKKVHRVLAFNQTSWMAAYINFNTQMRKQATSAFEKDLFKLLNNSVFGKTMENVRKYINIKLV